MITGRERLEWLEFAPPTPSPTGVVVDIAYCGICGTDIAAYRSGHLHSPAVCGHEWTGTISAVGRAARHVDEGDRVVIAVGLPCGRCTPCRTGRPRICALVDAQVRGRDDLAPPHGGFAASIAVEADRVLVADATLSDEDAAQVEPTAVTYRGVRRSGVTLGDTVVVQGAGAIGLLAAQLARAGGATTVVVVEPSPVRRAKAIELGADHAVAPGSDAVEVIGELTAGLGADVVYECSGIAALLQTAVDFTRRDGAMTMLGYSPDPASINTGRWISKCIRVVASVGFERTDLVHTMALIAGGRVDVAALHSRTVGLDDLPGVLADLAAGRADDTKVLVDPRA